MEKSMSNLLFIKLEAGGSACIPRGHQRSYRERIHALGMSVSVTLHRWLGRRLRGLFGVYYVWGV